MAQQKKRMGGMKLSSFGQSAALPDEPEQKPAAAPAQTSKPKAKPISEKLATLNIKVRKDQQRWLQDTAQIVRDNNLEAQPPQDRVYPQHLIGVAIDLLKSQNIEWSEIKTAEDLREHLNL